MFSMNTVATIPSVKLALPCVLTSSEMLIVLCEHCSHRSIHQSCPATVYPWLEVSVLCEHCSSSSSPQSYATIRPSLIRGMNCFIWLLINSFIAHHHLLDVSSNLKSLSIQSSPQLFWPPMITCHVLILFRVISVLWWNIVPLHPLLTSFSPYYTFSKKLNRVYSRLTHL